jgi:hypothetical protein
LTTQDLYAALPPLVDLEVVHNGSLSRHHAFTVHLLYIGPKVKGAGRRYTNTGNAGSPPTWTEWAGARETVAATWDEWGIWIDRLFAIDPNAIIGNYKGRDAFMVETARRIPRKMTAPWLAS